ncbi:hypothetical protein [Enterobacter roggenkampii]|uniref:hypothetical protein n=1 Tax=Enterobacter roggenkampii TaxID=1812935 RepID=UPI001953ABB9|nr:hypothetical protein [Enterobacter roggenkampii]
MKERGMIFNGEMVRAILHGRKTQTRRPANPSTANLLDLQEQYPHKKYNISCPFGAVGDRIWVRETWAEAGAGAPDLKLYRANYPEHVPTHYENVPPVDEIRWTPSIHMPRWASRITLEITCVRVERLNSISQKDAQAEGMELTGWRPTYSDPDSGGEVWTPYDNFAQLWESIYGEESWKANPWVWVIEFKVVPNVQDNPA